MTFQEVIAAILGPVGVLFALLFILWLGWKGVWVFGKHCETLDATWQIRYDEMKKELLDRIASSERRLDRAGHVAEGSTRMASRATELVARTRHEGSDEHVGT